MTRYTEVSAFTTTPGQGSRAGVVLDAAHLSRGQMQALAEFVGASETVFVTRMSDGLARVRYFTPTQEVEFCGHATIALGQVLAQVGRWRGERLELETLSGRVPLRLALANDGSCQVWMQQPALETRPLERRWWPELAEALGINERVIHRGLPVAAASTGLWSAFLPLLDSFVLDALEPDFARIRDLSAELEVGTLYVYAPMGVGRFAARDFAPLLGVPEDPVTGSAGGALVGLLAAQGKLPIRAGRSSGLIYQGHAIGTPGEVEVEIEMDGQQVARVHVGGRATIEHEGLF